MGSGDERGEDEDEGDECDREREDPDWVRGFQLRRSRNRHCRRGKVILGGF